MIPNDAAVARISLIVAAILWSAGGFFMRVLTAPTALDLNRPELTPIQVAFWRALFAGVVLIPFVRRSAFRFRPPMLAMVITFSAMCGLYLSALGYGSSANAILLQNTAPVWVYLIGVYILGHRADVGAGQATALAMVGAGVIVLGNWPWNAPPDEQSRDIPVLLMGAGSGLTYAGVVLFLGHLKGECPAGLMVLNLLGCAACIAGVVLVRFGWSEFQTWFAAPSAEQLLFLLLYGALQMAVPYWLFARGLRSVTAQEAGIITLLEPVLNPIWAYLVAPERETPTIWTIAGGGILLGALAWKYAPRRVSRRAPSSPSRPHP